MTEPNDFRLRLPLRLFVPRSPAKKGRARPPPATGPQRNKLDCGAQAGHGNSEGGCKSRHMRLQPPHWAAVLQDKELHGVPSGRAGRPGYFSTETTALARRSARFWTGLCELAVRHSPNAPV